MKKIFFLSFITYFFFSHFSYSQALSYVDPAIAYQRIMVEKGQEGTYQQLGNFKVIGTSFLFGEQLGGNAYAGNEKSSNIKLGYNMYNQTVELYINGSNLKIIKTPSEIDSFLISQHSSDFVKEDMHFVSSKSISNIKIKDCFLQVLYKGKNNSLYKFYTATLDYVSTNYIQSELRQFGTAFTYYLFDEKKGELKKIKLTRKKLMEEFSSITGIETAVSDEEFDKQPEQTSVKILSFINNNH